MPRRRTPDAPMPTARTALARGEKIEVWCNYCQRHRPLDLQALIDAGRGDEPLALLPFRCGGCGSRRTGLVVLTKGSGVPGQP